MFFWKRNNFTVEITKFPSELLAVGVLTQTQDKDVFKDVPRLAKEFADVKSEIKNRTNPWAFVVVTGKKSDDGRYTYFLGDLVTKADLTEDLISITIPNCEFAKITVIQHKSFGSFTDISRAREYFYEKWLPKSEYKLADVLTDMEYYDARSKIKPPIMDLYFPICKK